MNFWHWSEKISWSSPSDYGKTHDPPHQTKCEIMTLPIHVINDTVNDRANAPDGANTSPQIVLFVMLNIFSNDRDFRKSMNKCILCLWNLPITYCLWLCIKILRIVISHFHKHIIFLAHKNLYRREAMQMWKLWSVSQVSHMNRHLRNHTNETIVSDKSFLQVSDMNHTGEKPYKRDHWSLASKLKHRIVVHTRENPFKFKVCKNSSLRMED